MSGVNRAELREATQAVYDASYTSDYYTRVASDDSGPGLDLEYPVSLTALYASPDSEVFSKAYFPARDVSYEEAGALRMEFARGLTAKLSQLTDRNAINIVNDIRRGRDAYFENLEGGIPQDGTHILGVLAIHERMVMPERPVIQGNYVVFAPQPYPTAVMVAPTPFLDVLSETMPIETALDGIRDDLTNGNDERLLEAYSVISEHATEDTALQYRDFESFKEYMRQTVEYYETGEQGMTIDNTLTVVLGVSLLPAKYTHPVIQRELFEKPAA